MRDGPREPTEPAAAAAVAARANATPAMQRYLEVKAQFPGTLLLFRIGDFYELFYEDAQSAARVLGLTLTSRDKGSTNPVPMAGFPHHQLDNYLRKLIRAGLRAAVCEQVEDPALAKGLVKREVTRVVTPGTLTEEALLDPREHNYLAALAELRDTVGLAWLELSTGTFQACQVPPEQLADELARVGPAECLVPEGSDLPARLAGTACGTLTPRPAWCFAVARAQELLQGHFGVATLQGMGFDDQSAAAVASAGALLDYVQETQRGALGHITRLVPFARGSHLLIDEATRRSLELARTLREGQREGSLLWAIDETVTPMGARLLVDWLANPLARIDAIQARLEAVADLAARDQACRALREALRQAYDVARLAARVATLRAGPRDLRCLANTLMLLPEIKRQLAGLDTPAWNARHDQLDTCQDLASLIDGAVVPEPPASLAEGGALRAGHHAGLDELRDLARGGKEWMAHYQAREIERTGIPGLKIGFNKVFGYYLEMTSAQAARFPVPENYIRKQTLKNQERFVTAELKEHEDKVLRAEEQALRLEQELFAGLRARVAQEVPRLLRTASLLAEIDVLSGFARMAATRNYTRPQVRPDSVLEIREGRHPVLDRLAPAGSFVPNDTILGPEAGRVQIITGPNMAGKSTYIRQAALITILAQIGSFVPARSAVVGVADRIFARVGASDDLGRGQSTFMVEMTETARILHQATARSLVILDEIGRGTSTYDGISLAWAVTEYLHDVIGCRTLFATHYHELTELTATLSAARNWNVAVREDQEGVVFLHRIVEGAADKSYGIHVARLAGIPPFVIDRARVILHKLESDHLDKQGRPTMPPRELANPRERQLQLFHVVEHPLLNELRGLDPDRLTPLEALRVLHKLRGELDLEQPAGAT